MSETSILNRQLEFLLFGGVPERPEGTYEGDTYGQTSTRLTGRPNTGVRPWIIKDEGEVVATFRMSRKTREVEFEAVVVEGD